LPADFVAGRHSHDERYERTDEYDRFEQIVPAIRVSKSCSTICTLDDTDINLAISRAVALEIPNRGWKITKEKASHKIDVIVALGIACYAAINDTTVDVARLALALFGQLQLETDVVPDVKNTPEYAAMIREQNRPCHFCGLAVGPSSRPLGVDIVAHAGPCLLVGEPKAKDSFGRDIEPGKGNAIEALTATLSIYTGAE